MLRRNKADEPHAEHEIDGVHLDCTDFRLIDAGSILLLAPLADAAREWVNENIGADNGYQPYYPTVLIERRYLPAIVEEILSEGFSLAT